MGGNPHHWGLYLTPIGGYCNLQCRLKLSHLPFTVVLIIIIIHIQSFIANFIPGYFNLDGGMVTRVRIWDETRDTEKGGDGG